MYIQRAELWKHFDVEKHYRGVYAVWDLKETKKKKKKIKENFTVIPASNPISFSKGQKEMKKKTKKNWEQRRNAVAGLFFIKCDVHFTHK